MWILLKPILKYVIAFSVLLVTLSGIYFKGRIDGRATLQAKIDIEVAQIKAAQVEELKRQSEEKDKIISELNIRSSEQKKQVQTIIKTVKITDNKECTLSKEAIDLLNKVR